LTIRFAEAREGQSVRLMYNHLFGSDEFLLHRQYGAGRDFGLQVKN